MQNESCDAGRGPDGVASALLLDKHEFIVSCQLCLGKYHVKKVVGFSNKATRTGIMAIFLILLL